MLTYLAIADRYRPKVFVWENVPGVLSSNSGRDFGTFLGALAKIGYGFAYRILDAQYFGVPQRRRRVFVVGYLGNWRRAASILFERESLSGNPPPCRQKGKGVAGTIGARTGRSIGAQGAANGHMLPVEGFRMRAFGSYVNDETASAMKMRDYKDATDLVAIGLDEEQNALVDGFGTLKARTEGGGFEGSVMQSDMQVRRLTPKECARLQGFSDDYLDIGFNGKPAADGPKYKALGNSMAVPVMAWLGSRLQNG